MVLPNIRRITCKKERSGLKRSDFIYSEWKCILRKDLRIVETSTEEFRGHIGRLDILEVSEPQVWKIQGEDITVCDKGLKWLSILPKEDYYCITAMLNEKGEALLWYIDMIAGQGVEAGVPYFDDLYLDLVVFPDGTIKVDDLDELEEALENKEITDGQFHLAVETAKWLQEGLLSDMERFQKFTRKCYEMVEQGELYVEG